jgi:hypothetical protein
MVILLYFLQLYQQVEVVVLVILIQVHLGDQVEVVEVIVQVQVEQEILHQLVHLKDFQVVADNLLAQIDLVEVEVEHLLLDKVTQQEQMVEQV